MSDTPARSKKKLYMRRWFQLCVAFVVVLPILFMLSLFGVKLYLIDWFKQNGAETAAIEKLTFNPFLGRLTLNGLDVQVDGKSLLKNSEMVVDVGFAALFNKNIKVQSAHYSGLVLDLEQKGDGSLRIGSYTLGGSEETTVATTEDTGSTWAFLADNVDIENCLVKMKTPDFDLELIIEKAQLRKFTTREGKDRATFTLEGLLDKQPIQIQLSDVQVAPYLHIEGDVKVGKFQLTEIATLLKDVLPVFSGDVEIDGAVAFSLDGDGGVFVDYSGLIDVVNPDIGSPGFGTRAENLKWQGTVHFESVADTPMVVATDGVLFAQKYELDVDGDQFTTNESLIELEGKNRVTIGENVVVENDGRLRIEKSGVDFSGTSIQPELLDWQGTVRYNSNYEGTGQYVDTNGELQLGPLAYSSVAGESKNHISGKKVSWKGGVTYGQENEKSSSYVLLDGKLDGADIGVDIASISKITQQGLSLLTDSKITFGEVFDIKGTNSLALQGFIYEGTDQAFKVSLDQMGIKDLQALGNKNLQLKQLNSEGLSVTVAGSLPLEINVPTIQLLGLKTGDVKNYDVESFSLKSPQIVATHNGEELLKLAEINATNLNFNEAQQLLATELSLSRLVFLGVREGAEVEPFLTLAEATLTDFSWSADDGLSGTALNFSDLVTTVIKDTKGEFNLNQRLAAMTINEGGEVSQKEGEGVDSNDGDSMPIRLGKVAFTGKNHVKFEDYTLAVPYLTDLEIKEMEFRNLDSTQPEAKSPFVLNAQLEERAPFTIEGDISPFMAPVAVDVNIKLKNYPLARLSSYTVQSVGTALASGQLKLETGLKLEDNNLDMKNKVTLNRLETKTISPELADELDNQLPIPLDTALSLLRDSDRNISLDIPLSGPVSDLDVGISDVLITALSKAIVPAASGYLMYALGPYGALAYVGMKVGEKMLKVELPPVKFTPGETAFAEEYKKYLEKVAEVLRGRPETDIQLCPQVVSWEFMDEKTIQATDGSSIAVNKDEQKKLIELGQSRAIEVQDYLADSYGIEKSRLLICDTTIAEDKKETPKVLLNL